jgi:phosphatidate cytidylyltransferase
MALSNLQQRLLTAAVAIPLLILIFWAGGLWFLALVLFVIFVGMSEFYHLAEAKGLKPQRVIGTIAALGLGLNAFYGNPNFAALILTAAVLVCLAFQLFRLDLSTAVTGAATTLMGVLYVGWLLSHLVLLRNWPEPFGQHDLGFFLVILVIATTFLADAGAYFTGRSLGRHKLWPRISPSKTWEGAVGGVVVGSLGLLATKLVFDRWIFPTHFPWYHALILGPLLVVVSIFGDLAESMLKRDAGIKDSGKIVPGHGGILDRLDSILFVVPTAYYYLLEFVY